MLTLRGEMVRNVLALTAALSVMACASGSPTTSEGDTGESHTAASTGPIALTIAVSNEVRTGATLPMTLTLKNTSSAPVALSLGGDSSRVQFDLAVTRPDGSEVWRYVLTDRGSAATLRLHTRTLEPGEALELTAEWELRNNSGESVAPGTYRLRGMVYAAPANVLSDVRSLTIRP